MSDTIKSTNREHLALITGTGGNFTAVPLINFMNMIPDKTKRDIILEDNGQQNISNIWQNRQDSSSWSPLSPSRQRISKTTISKRKNSFFLLDKCVHIMVNSPAQKKKARCDKWASISSILKK